MIAIQLQKRLLKLNLFPNDFTIVAYNKTSALDLEYSCKRRLFWDTEKHFEKNLQINLLTDEENAIHQMHNKAIQCGHFSYNDPFSNEKVVTRLRHFLRGTCCGKACRHCIYEHSNVTNETRKRQFKFNGAFWVQRSIPEEYDDGHYFDGSNLRRVKPPLKSSFQVSIKLPSQK